MRKTVGKTQFTKEEAIKYHRELWNWLADNPSSKKDNWPGWTEYNFREENGFVAIIGDCFCCHYTDQFGSGCNMCPLDFAANNSAIGTEEYCLSGLYGDWFTSKGNSRIELAKEIANLPERIYDDDTLRDMRVYSKTKNIRNSHNLIADWVSGLIRQALQGNDRETLASDICGETLYDQEVEDFWGDEIEDNLVESIEGGITRAVKYFQLVGERIK